MSGVVTATLWGRVKAPRRHEEDDLQASVCEYLKWALPDDGTFYAVPNGGKRHAREAARMVRLGVRAGVPDLAIVFRGRPIFIELKTARGVVSEHQKQMARRLTYCGADVLYCRSVDGVENALRELGVPLRASVS